MIPQEEMTATADRLTDALTAAAAIMPPDEAHALSSPIPGRHASPASRPVRRRMGRLRAWLVPAGVAAIVTSSGGSLQAHSHLLFSQGDHCAVCVYTAITSSDEPTLTAAAASSVPPSPSHPGMPRYRLWVLQLSLATGQPSGILYRSAASNGSYDAGLVPVLSADGQAQHWFLVLDPEQFGWISGGKLSRSR